MKNLINSRIASKAFESIIIVIFLALVLAIAILALIGSLVLYDALEKDDFVSKIKFVQKKPLIPRDGNFFYKVVEIDDCEYIVTDLNLSTRTICHKGNCKSCAAKKLLKTKKQSHKEETEIQQFDQKGKKPGKLGEKINWQDEIAPVASLSECVSFLQEPMEAIVATDTLINLGEN